MTQGFEPEISIPISDLKRVIGEANLDQVIAQCESEPGGTGECVAEALLDKVIQMYSPPEDGATSMTEFIQGDDDPDSCRECALPVAVQWYSEELKEQGHPDMAQQLELTAREQPALTVAQRMDTIKAEVDGPLRDRLLEFDAATQLNT